mmetsp:Transcript_23566/g.56289  ORF Transcript_23566/g.56289 Transcript_23566/m.56289 type:complete len:231 (-) Transcript_23566:446-1138(-)
MGQASVRRHTSLERRRGPRQAGSYRAWSSRPGPRRLLLPQALPRPAGRGDRGSAGGRGPARQVRRAPPPRAGAPLPRGSGAGREDPSVLRAPPPRALPPGGRVASHGVRAARPPGRTPWVAYWLRHVPETGVEGGAVEEQGGRADGRVLQRPQAGAPAGGRAAEGEEGEEGCPRRRCAGRALWARVGQRSHLRLSQPSQTGGPVEAALDDSGHALQSHHQATRRGDLREP